MNGHFAISVRWLLGWSYKSSLHNADESQDETAIHCDPALSVLFMLVSRIVFHVVTALKSIVGLSIFWRIRSLVDLTLIAFTVCGLLQFLDTHPVCGSKL